MIELPTQTVLPLPSVAGPARIAIDARRDGTCAAVRGDRVVVLHPTESGWREQIVDSQVPNGEVALDPLADRFVVWTTPAATVSALRSIAVFRRSGEVYERVEIWKARSMPAQPARKPVWAGFTGDRLVAQIDVPNGPIDAVSTLEIVSLDGTAERKTVELGRRVELVRVDGDRCLVIEGRTLRWIGLDGTSGEVVATIPSSGPLPVAAGVALSDDAIFVGDPRASVGGHVHAGEVRSFARATGAAAEGATWSSPRPRPHERFAACVAVGSAHVAITAVGLARAPRSHNEHVPAQAQTTLFDPRGAIVAQLPAWRPELPPDPTPRHSLVRITDRHVLEHHGDAVHVFRIAG